MRAEQLIRASRGDKRSVRKQQQETTGKPEKSRNDYWMSELFVGHFPPRFPRGFLQIFLLAFKNNANSLKYSRKIGKWSENFEINMIIFFGKFLIFWVFLGNFPAFPSIFPGCLKTKTKYIFGNSWEMEGKVGKFLENTCKVGNSVRKFLVIFAEFCDASECFWWIV